MATERESPVVKTETFAGFISKAKERASENPGLYNFPSVPFPGARNQYTSSLYKELFSQSGYIKVNVLFV